MKGKTAVNIKEKEKKKKKKIRDPRGFLIDRKGNVIPFGEVFYKGEEIDSNKNYHGTSFYSEEVYNTIPEEYKESMGEKNEIGPDYLTSIQKHGLIYILNSSNEKEDLQFSVFLPNDITERQLKIITILNGLFMIQISDVDKETSKIVKINKEIFLKKAYEFIKEEDLNVFYEMVLNIKDTLKLPSASILFEEFPYKVKNNNDDLTETFETYTNFDITFGKYLEIKEQILSQKEPTK